MGIAVIGALFLGAALNAGNFAESHPEVFKAYATLAAIKAIDSHVESLALMGDAMSQLGNHSEVNNIACTYRQCCETLTKPSKKSSLAQSWGTSLEDYRRYTESKQVVAQFINVLPPLYKEICTFDGKELISADCGLWPVKGLLPCMSSSLEALAALVDDIQIYCAVKNPGEQFFNKIINSAASTFTTEKIAQLVAEHSAKSSALTVLYAKNAQIVSDWAAETDKKLQVELVSLQTTNPQWKIVGATRQSHESLFTIQSSDGL